MSKKNVFLWTGQGEMCGFAFSWSHMLKKIRSLAWFKKSCLQFHFQPDTNKDYYIPFILVSQNISNREILEDGMLLKGMDLPKERLLCQIHCRSHDWQQLELYSKKWTSFQPSSDCWFYYVYLHAIFQHIKVKIETFSKSFK